MNNQLCKIKTEFGKNIVNKIVDSIHYSYMMDLMTIEVRNTNLDSKLYNRVLLEELINMYYKIRDITK